jgi:hypothetical protein
MNKINLLKSVIIGLAFMTSSTLLAQIKVGDNPDVVNPASAIEVESTTKGILLPRMTTTQMNAILTPPNGLMVFNITDSCTFYYHNAWKSTCNARTGGISMADTDNDTRIQLEKTSDDDLIRFDAAGNEVLTINSNSDLSLQNEGTVGAGSAKIQFLSPTGPGSLLNRKILMQNKVELRDNNLSIKDGSGSNDRIVLKGNSSSPSIEITDIVTSEKVKLGTDGDSYLNIDGNFGVGTTTPQERLHVDANNDSLQFENLAGTGSGLAINAAGKVYRANIDPVDSSEWTNQGDYTLSRRAAASGDTVVISDNGLLGIGTAAPETHIDVFDPSFAQIRATGNNVRLRLRDNDATINTDGHQNYILFDDKDDTPTGVIGFATGGRKMQISNNMTGELSGVSITNGSGGIIDLDSVGNVGIGRTDAKERLDVNGAIRAGDDISVTGSVMLRDKYWSGSLVNLGTEYSSGNGLLSYGVRSKVGAAGFTSTSPISMSKSVLKVGQYLDFRTADRAVDIIGDDVSLTSRLYIENDGDVGIGTTAPGGKFYVNNDKIGSDSSFVVKKSGNIGIGISAPAYKLDLNGNMRFGQSGAYTQVVGQNSSLAGYNGVFEFYPQTIPGSGQAEHVTYFKSNLGSGTSGINRHSVLVDGALGVGTSGLPTGKFHVDNDAVGSDSSFVILANGNVGIGTTSPTTPLEVQSNDGIGNNITIKDLKVGTALAPTLMGVEYVGYSNKKKAGIYATDEASNFDRGQLIFKTQNSGGSLSEKMRIRHDGNIGIGTNDPSQNLTIRDNASTIRLEAASSPTGYYSEIVNNYNGGDQGYYSIQGQRLIGNKLYSAVATTNTTTYINARNSLAFTTSVNNPTTAAHVKMVLDRDGKLGIGTTGPDYQLDVVHSVAELARFTRTSGGDIQLAVSSGDAQIRYTNSTASTGTWFTGVENADNSFHLGTGTTLAGTGTKLIVLSTGNVGIGENNPDEKLEVNGTIKATDINFTNLPVHADEAAAIAAGTLSTGDLYMTATGEIRIKL